MNFSEEQLAKLWLASSESLSYKARERIVKHFGSALLAFENFSSEALSLMGEKAFYELNSSKGKGLLFFQKEMDNAKAKAVFLEDKEYPTLLKQIQDPPFALFYYGKLPQNPYKAVAIVGSRRETKYGSRMAQNIAEDLALNNVIVVSGLAYGIDSAAHKGSLKGKGKTVAVLGSGLKNIYPKDNIPLARDIIKAGGCILSEYPLDSKPLPYHFPVRNRIVSGLCQAVLLIEAREKSGTLITIGHALNQGREVFALPGPVDMPTSAAPHRILKEGACICTGAHDILENMGWEEAQLSFFDNKTDTEKPKDLTKEQLKIYDSLYGDTFSFEELLEKTSLCASEANANLVLMEMYGYIESLPGGMYRRKNV
ncbi:MAG: DNA-processing protein DprA [Eubacteriales bacterium]|nr:DNA-processing protein DprA [Eubacteriales bacterium]